MPYRTQPGRCFLWGLLLLCEEEEGKSKAGLQEGHLLSISVWTKQGVIQLLLGMKQS